MTSTVTRRGVALLLLALAATAPLPAVADGMYFPEKSHVVPVAIPAQRAILVHRNGVETLTVESTLDARGQAFGWVVPVPATPTSVEKGTRGPLDVLDRVTGPEVVHGTGFSRGAGPWALLFLGLLLLSRARLLRAGFTGRGIFDVLMIWVAGLFVFSLTLGVRGSVTKGGGGGFKASLDREAPTIPGVHASPTRRVGSYEVTVLRADAAGALGRWLEANGFATLPPGGAPVVEAHVREGWSFVAVRLLREEEGRAAPHPLRIVFPAAAPIYPMRLTALAGGVTAVRLYVVMEGGGSGPGLATIFRDRFPRVVRGAATPPGAGGWARGEGLGTDLLHPRLLADLWDGCTLTRLEGKFRPGDMERDIVLAGAPAGPHLARFWSAEGARDAAARWSLLPWACLAFVLLFVPPAHLPLKGRRGTPFLHGLLALTLGAGAVFLAVRWTLPVIAVEEVPYSYSGARGHPWQNIPGSPPLDLRGRTAAECEDLVRQEFSKRWLPPPSVGDSPGEFEVLDTGDSPTIRFYGEHGEPLDGWVPETR